MSPQQTWPMLEFCSANDCLELQAGLLLFPLCPSIPLLKGLHSCCPRPTTSPVSACSPAEPRLKFRVQLNWGSGALFRPQFARTSNSRSFWLRGGDRQTGQGRGMMLASAFPLDGS